MSSYHETVKRVLTEINKFLSVTLKSEILTPKAQKERNRVIEQLSKLFADYDSLAPTFGDEGSTSSAKELGSNSGSIDESRNTGESGQGSEDDSYADNIPETSVKALQDPTPIKIGYLDRRQKSLLSIQSWTKRYCVIHKNVMYCFKKSSDKKQEMAFFVTGYELVESPQHVKEAAKKESCFELVCPGKKSYQFIADSKEDLQSWKEAIQEASKEQTVVNGVDDEDDGDIYEDFPDEQPTTRKPSAPSIAIIQPSPTTPDPDIYDEGESTPASRTDQNQNISQEDESDEIYEPIDPEVPPGRSAATKSVKKESKSPTTPTTVPPPVPPHVPKTPNTTPLPPLPTKAEVPPPLPGRNAPLPPPPKEPLPAIPGEKPVKKPSLAKILDRSEDFENLFYSMWSCKGSNSNELSFQRGEVIHVISRDLDIDSWWVGELDGKIGLVPKTFLSPAFEEIKF